MRRASLIAVSVVSLVVSVPRAARAQMYESVGIRAQGMGGAFVGLADDSTATWWNPAGIAGGPYFDILAEFGRLDATSDQDRLAFAAAIPSLGLSYYRLPISQMQPLTSTGGTVSSRQDQGYLNQFGMTVGQSLGGLVVATTLKVLNAQGDTHVDLDVGAMVTVGHLKAGISLRNLHETTYGSGVDLLSLQRIARAGASYTVPLGSAVLIVAGDADLTSVMTLAAEEKHVAGGAEVWVWKRIIGVRGGLSAETIHSVNSHSGGLSIMVLSGKSLHTYLDGQWTGGSDLMRRGWGLDLRLTF